MEHKCDHKTCMHANAPATQTLEELNFERGLWTAAIQGDILKAKEKLNKKEDPNKRDESGYAPLHYAARWGKQAMCELLVDAGACINVVTRVGLATPLHRASYCGHVQVVEFLIKKGAEINMQDADGMTALHKVCFIF
eukprot:TRINITY_DN15668_c0_g1_i1.p1 TRINITY_DN15668_c0_g1~~TRINITY_DN15668_c0_g1_i1.p1  ORF type:complete len:138 (-),score=21.45 TRINITY_DN15668_c0_g1_i1:270-683(-)